MSYITTRDKESREWTAQGNRNLSGGMLKAGKRRMQWKTCLKSIHEKRKKAEKGDDT
jgi:hypothetical protein